MNCERIVPPRQLLHYGAFLGNFRISARLGLNLSNRFCTMSSSLNLHLLIILGYVNIITLMTPHYNTDGLGWSWYKFANEEAHGQG